MHRRYDQTNVPIEILRSFVTILDSGSYSKAAQQVGLTQSAISAQMKRLQTILQDPLFERGAAHLTLTKKGELTASFARRIIALNDQLVEENIPGLNVGMPLLFGGIVLRDFIDTCRAAGLGEVRYHCDASVNLIKSFEAGQLDALVVFSMSPRHDARIAWSEQMVWVCSKAFKPDLSKPIPWLSWPESTVDEIAEAALLQSGARHRKTFVATDLSSHIEAVYSNLGYRVMARNAVPADLRIAEDARLPNLPAMQVSILVNPELDHESAAAVATCLEHAARAYPARLSMAWNNQRASHHVNDPTPT